MKIDGNTPVSLNLPLEFVHTILTVLGTQPYDKVASMVASIQQQTSVQLQALQSNPTDDSKPSDINNEGAAK